MAVNRGVYPLDPTSDVGKFRLLYGDVDSIPLVPPELGFQNYTELSDDEIDMFLAQGSESISRAIGFYYLRLSGDAAKQSKSIADYDLKVDTTKRAADLRAIAEMWFGRADDEDDLNGLTDIFDIFDLGTHGDVIPELSIPIWGRRYVIDRVS